MSAKTPFFKYITLLAVLVAPLFLHAEVPGDSVPVFPDANELEEVVITAKKPVIQQEADKLTYNMEEDSKAQTQSVLDAMRSVPMLSVDGDGNIQLKGSGNFKIYMNGKPDPSLDSNYKDILRALPASSIKKIEVITEPGAKYDAEGVGGIINIITTSSTRLEGYSVSLNARGGTDSAGGGVNALTKVGKVSMNLNYMYSHQFGSPSTQEQRTEYLHNDREHLYTMRMYPKQKGSFQMGSFQLAWEPDTLNLVTVNANLMGFGGHLKFGADYNMADIRGQQVWSYKGLQDYDINYTSLNASTSYQHTFPGDKEHNIIFSFLYSYGGQRTDLISQYYDLVNYTEPLPGTKSLSRYPSNEYTLQVDYTLPFLKRHKFEAGGKYIFRRNHGDTYGANEDTPGVWTEDPANTVDLRQFQDVGALYAAYTGKFSPFTIKAGLRYEYTHMGARFSTEGYDDYTRNLSNLVPNALVSCNLPGNNTVSATYQMRISRPSVEQLSPHRTSMSPLDVSYGNPALSSVRFNKVGISYSNYMLPVQVSFNADYTVSNNRIEEYTFLGEGGVLNSTRDNIGRYRGLTLFTYLAFNRVRGLRLSVSGSANYEDYRADKIDARNHGWGYNVNINANYELPLNFEVFAWGGLGDGGVGLQTTGMKYNYHGIGIAKSLLKEKRLRISLNAQGIFTPHTTYDYSKTGPDYIQYTHSRNRSWSLTLGVTWRLGNFNSMVRSVDKSIENDDVLSSGGSGVGGMKQPTNN